MAAASTTTGMGGTWAWRRTTVSTCSVNSPGLEFHLTAQGWGVGGDSDDISLQGLLLLTPRKEAAGPEEGEY